MIWTFKLNFDVNNLAFFCLATVLATFNKIGQIIFQSSGHTDIKSNTNVLS
jgi:hypothetical protein